MNEPPVTPWTVALAVLGAALCLVAVAVAFSAQFAVILLGLYAFAGAAVRAAAPIARAFAVRRRSVDVGVLVVAGGALVFLGLTTPLG